MSLTSSPAGTKTWWYLFVNWCWFVFRTISCLRPSIFLTCPTTWLMRCLDYSCRPSDSWHRLTCTRTPQRYLCTCSHPMGRHSLLFVAVQSLAILFPTHKRAWALFRQFFESIFHLPCPGLPISSSVLALFIAYSFDKQYAPSTVNTYVSALGFHVG